MTETVTTRDGVQVSLDVYPRGRDTAVLICPGFFQSKDTPTFQRMSRVLDEVFDVLAMDFRGHGRSSGRYTFSVKEGADLEAVLDWASPRYRWLGIMGFSLGGAVMLNTLSRRPQAAHSLIAVSAPSAFEDIEFKFWTPEAMRTGILGLEAGAGCRPGSPLLTKERPVESVARVSGAPVLFIHGTHDVIVGVDHSRRLFAAAREPKRLEIIEQGSHAEALFRDDPEGFARLVNGWWIEKLGVNGR